MANKREIPFRTLKFGFLAGLESQISLFLAGWVAFAAAGFGADNIGILGSKPKWDVLEHYQHTITHDEFAHLVNDVYCTHGIPSDLIKIDNDAARIVTEDESSSDMKVRDTDSKEIASNPGSQNLFTLQFEPDA